MGQDVIAHLLHPVDMFHSANLELSIVSESGCVNHIDSSLNMHDQDESQPLELSIPFPRIPHKNIYFHLTVLSTSIMLLLTSKNTGEGDAGAAPLGSFVYSLPDRFNPANPLCTLLCFDTSNVDYATRVAKSLVRKTRLPVYVGCSIDLVGIAPDEEMDSLAKVIEVVSDQWNLRSNSITNGI